MIITEVTLVAMSVGVLGGLVRALYGLLKATSKGFEIHPWHFLITLVISAFIGGLLGIVFSNDYRIAALAGYVGTDILENVFKGSIGKSVMIRK
jgi:ABC-type xylose transport system permease subunit